MSFEYRVSPFGSSEYNVGWICALPLEMAASLAVFDDYHGHLRGQDSADTNNYRLGRIGAHNIVIACLGSGKYGNNSAAMVAVNMNRSFKFLRVRLMVGIGGGVPSDRHDIRLGDIVVSRPGNRSGGVIQYDFGKSVGSGEFMQTGSLSSPPAALLTAVSALGAELEVDGISIFTKHLKNLGNQFQYPNTGDSLYASDYGHANINDKGCKTCDPEQLLKRPDRPNKLPVVHYGLIASGNQVMKDAVKRDQLREEHDILCFEMEAAGLMDSFACLVVRGICDYSDSHKYKGWQRYAAATAAAYAKHLLCNIPGDVDARDTILPGLASKSHQPMGNNTALPYRLLPEYTTSLDETTGRLGDGGERKSPAMNPWILSCRYWPEEYCGMWEDTMIPTTCRRSQRCVRRCWGELKVILARSKPDSLGSRRGLVSSPLPINTMFKSNFPSRPSKCVTTCRRAEI